MKINCRLLAVITLLPFIQYLQAQENDIRGKLDASRLSFEKESEEIRKAVLKHFDDVEARARQKGDSAGLNLIEEERGEFQQSGTFPDSLPANLLRRHQFATSRIMIAYDNSKKQFLTRKEDAAAADIEKELARLEETNMKVRDPIPLGSKWSGPRFGVYANKKPFKNNGSIVDAEILKRTKDTFQIRLKVRPDLVFTADFRLVKDKWVAEKVDADPAGAARPGLVPVQRESIRISAKQLEIDWEAPAQFQDGMNREKYQLKRVIEKK